MPTREPREVTESYRIERVLKSSRSGIVFRAQDPASGRSVAIKMMPPPAQSTKSECDARFAALAARLLVLQPPGVPKLRDFGLTPDGSAFLVMDLVEGTPLDTAGDLAPTRVVTVLLATIETLASLAAKGILHGNLSPDNLLLGPADSVWVVGLGTAAFRPPSAPAHAVLDGAGAEFAAPERFDPAGTGAADWRADLYSLALTACSLLRAEVAPLDSPAPGVAIPSDVARELRDPNALRAALELALRRLPEQRPTSYDVLRDALRRAIGAATAAAEPAAVPAVVEAPPMQGEPAPPAASPSAQQAEWEPPDGAPAWLQDSAPAFVLAKPEVPAPEPAAEKRDEREDTNPVPLTRKAELPSLVKGEPPTVAPTLGAPSSLPTPVIAGPPAPPAATPLPAPPQTLEPAPATPAAAPATPPEAPATPPPVVPPAVIPLAPPAPAPLSPVTAEAGTRSLDATPPTGGYKLPPPEAPPVVAAPPPAQVAPAPPPSPPAAVEAPAPSPPPAEPVAPKPAPPATPKRSRWLVPALGAAAVVVVGAAGLFVGMSVLRARQAAPLAPSPVPTRPRPTVAPQQGTSPATLEKLRVAEEAAASGDPDAAQTALEGITAEDEVALGPGETSRLTRVRTSVVRLRQERIMDDLRTGLAGGNLRVLRETVRRVTPEVEAAIAGDPDAGQALEEARRAVNLLGLATKAQQAGNDAQALQHASALVEVVPRSTQAAELREKAAAGLEHAADAALQRGQFDEADEHLATIGRYWSARPGLAQARERVRAGRASEQRLTTLVEQAEQTESARQPERGLELLRSAAPPPYLQERFRQARARLEAALARLDANPPVVEVAPGLKLEFQKNKPFTLAVRITDDHAVKSAALFARVKGTDGYQELPLIRGQGNEWRGEITPALHQNKAVELYVTATDSSGHVGQAGTAQQPLQLKKKWSLFGM